MKERILSTAVLWAILAVALLHFGDRGCQILLIMASALTQYEFYKLLQLAGYEPFVTSGVACGIGMQGQYLFEQYFCPLAPGESLTLAATAIACCLFAKRSTEILRESLLPTLLGIAYVPFMFAFSITFVNDMGTFNISPNISLHTLFWLVAVAKFSDVGGMIFGFAFGKRKLAPDLSPNKTLEGLGGGVITSTAVGVITFLIFRHSLISLFTLPHVILLSGILSIIAALGDLVESAIKRLAGVKDSGKLVPGIGGIFDLTDSLILALPIGILYIKYAIL
ncbi:MAG: phosphatidate cytidylyltransferase [Puniceicoccales bacterium]|jgi:phosphatidate cytidylyltransferase|nr:phosphatidate cytidylyltransferase [Puniceicoccales bacterium]